jgi:nicotinamide-nucleotide amidase
MKGCVIAVGSELLTPFRQDTNSLAITARLNEVGVDVRQKLVVGDDLEDLSAAFAGVLTWSDVLIVTGGLGPTEDDLTREAIARTLDRPLELDEGLAEGLRRRFERAGLPMRANNQRQALVPRGAIALANTRGTAPGLWLERGTQIIVLLPGPPREMTPMLDAVVRDRLAPRFGGASLVRRAVRLVGRTESDVDAQAEPIYSRWRTGPVPIATTILAMPTHIELQLSARSSSEATAAQALDRAVKELQASFGQAIVSVDGRSLEAVVGELLRDRRLTLAVAESCTGGLLTSRLTDVPGSSAYVERGIVGYSNRAKVELLGVPEDLLAAHGAVSEPVARAMAEGVRARAGTDVGIGVTGIAGPDGGTPEKPVGTVAIAVQYGDVTRVSTFRLLGDREQIKLRSVQAALNMLRLLLEA